MTPTPFERVLRALNDGTTPQDRAVRLDDAAEALGKGAAQDAFRAVAKREVERLNEGVAESGNAVVDTTSFHARMSALYAAWGRLAS